MVLMVGTWESPDGEKGHTQTHPTKSLHFATV
ncbi:hypothetical protein EK904_005238 [Melospiza melodia maxima]|nr:hypothetical protein EK904_005238 [Melospiza melodia maxima]